MFYADGVLSAWMSSGVSVVSLSLTAFYVKNGPAATSDGFVDTVDNHVSRGIFLVVCSISFEILVV